MSPQSESAIEPQRVAIAVTGAMSAMLGPVQGAKVSTLTCAKMPMDVCLNVVVQGVLPREGFDLIKIFLVDIFDLIDPAPV